MQVSAFAPVITYVYPAADGNYTDRLWPHKIHTLHCVQCPPGKGWVRSLLGPNYFGSPTAGVSIHWMVDAGDTGQGAPPGLQCWHVGGPGNQLASGTEQAGYASFTTAMWEGAERTDGTAYYTRPDGTRVTWTAQNNADMAAQFERLAQLFAEIHRAQGIPLRWLTDAELRQARADYNAGRTPTVTGFCRHQDWTASGASNTSHVDPGDNYPADKLMARAQAIAGIHEAPNPAPTPTPPEEDDMPTAKEIVDELLGRTFDVRDATETEPAKVTKTFRLSDLLPALYNEVTQSARDAYAVRNATEAKAIRATIDAALQDPANGDKIGLRVWAQKITGTTLGAGDILGRLFGRGGQS